MIGHMALIDLTTARPMCEPLAWPTWGDIRAMIRDRSIAIVLIICCTVIGLAALTAVVLLAVWGRDTTVVGALLAGFAAVVVQVVKSVRARKNGGSNGDTVSDVPGPDPK